MPLNLPHRDGPPLPNDSGFGTYGGVAVPDGDTFVYVGGSTIDANSKYLYRCEEGWREFLKYGKLHFDRSQLVSYPLIVGIS